ncbi:hypothetical protein LUA82_01060 [Neoehrlichia mikurensis]|uniref:Uncharacterized protein n=1 Tax=Neoehrlichia mikurensis TaxID=89586 RepID=A0A9Q9BT54_9RICK|nr:hypothetical protein [Neoehrlichia mikurensis]UTO55662.1 hypothetical protein LUA82_01060 [Neoehrlichia mikurensis]UTO56582.1 hypothetical protein LUA81_01060 [Neoehrlichia mikurensis]
MYIDNTAHEVVSVKGTSDRAVSLESKVQEAMFIEGKNSVLELYNSRENKNLWSVVTHVIEVEERNFGLQANHHNASLSVSHEGNIEEMLADAMREDVDDKLEEVVYIDNTAHEVVSVKGTSDRAVSLESKVQEAMFIEGKNSVLELYNEEKSKTYNATVFLDKYRERNISDTIGDATYDKFDYLNDISMYNDEVIMAEYCQLSESSKRVINQLVKVVTKGVSSGQSNAAMVPVLQDKELNLLKVFKWLNDDINVEYDYRASLQEENLRCAIFKNDKQQFSRIRNEIFMNQQKILQVFDVMKEMTQQYFANNAAICQKMNQIATFQQEIVDNMGTSINNFNALYNKLKTRIFPIMGNYNAEKKQAFINFHNINVRDCFNEQISECYAMSKLLESYKTVDNRLEVQESCAKLNKDINKLIDNITVTNLIVNFSTRKLTTCFAFDLENSSDVGILEFCNFNKYKNRIVWNSRPLLSKSVNAINAFSDQIANMDCNSMLACTRDDAISTPMDQIDNVDCGDVSTRMENIDVRNMQQKQRIVA